MADQIEQAGQAVAQPVLEMVAEWGRVYLRITDVWLARGVAIGAFYLANRALTMLAVRRAVERRDPDNPDQPADPQVGLEAEVDSLLVPVIFYSQLGYEYFASISNGPFLKSCLQREMEKIGYERKIKLSLTRWNLPNLPEDRAVQEEKAREEGSVTDTPEEEKEEAMEVTKPLLHVELQDGPLKELTANLQPYKDLPTAQRFFKAYSCLEKAVVILNSASSSGYKEGEGVEHLLEGLMLMECVGPDAVNPVLYDRSWLHLDKTHLDNHVFAQLQANPNSTPCLLIQALQLPHGHTRIDAINHVIDIVLQHGDTDPIYKHLTYMYCALGITTLAVTKQAGLALSAYASALMYKPDDMLTLQLTALCSVSVSVSQAIRQFRHFLAKAPSCHEAVPWALYHLASLYSQQDTYVHRDTILHYYNMAQEADTNRLPAFKQVQSEHTEPASKGYKQVMVYVQAS
ncbi:uncharacterized protein LOC118412705 [Branchiostoma floridae]|uniref:Uncharacterized protein LOC118412705 n=1 Tax=Branchiostoma floridae TaxID=7739 RepID=C3ZJY6_BRAFL|nr:uncharacterized protein LOC118412705 [Branchiostoma floridae]|eukprot:XP_002591142.1 hypothetical protein BRAFLDRAFT_105511 [Branchiostoma floridae]